MNSLELIAQEKLLMELVDLACKKPIQPHILLKRLYETRKRIENLRKQKEETYSPKRMKL